MALQTTTIDDIVDDLIFKLDKEEVDALLNPPDEGKAPTNERLAYFWAKTTFLRDIRNEYGLWHTHPLTARWRSEGPNDLRDGVDYSIDHPDNVSGQIFERLIERLRLSRK